MTLLTNSIISPSQKRGGLTFIVALLLFGGLVYYFKQQPHRLFEGRGKAAWGTILDVHTGRGCWMEVQIHVNEHYYVDSRSIRLSLKKARVMYNRNISVPVLYDSLDPTDTYPLIYKEDFDYYGISYPDSLREIHQLILNLK